MIVLEYQKKLHKQIITACVNALKQGKVLAYPTDTSYGLAVDATNVAAVKKLYEIKGRGFNKPVHVVVPSLVFAKKITAWNKIASKLAKKFWSGPLTLVLGLKAESKAYKLLSANTNFLGLRMPKHKVALDLTKYLNRPITATSANFSGKGDCYSAQEIIKQFKNNKLKPDIIINAGKLPKRKPSTLIKIENNHINILRTGPISEKAIREAVGSW